MPRNSPGEQIRDLLHVIVHPKHNKPANSRYYDIAIIKVQPLTLNQDVRKIYVPEEATDSSSRGYDIPASIIGWGALMIGGPPTDMVHEASVTVFQKR